MSDILLVDCCLNNGLTFQLNESTNGANSTMRIKGICQVAEAVNKNKRRYPFEVLDENVQKLQEIIKKRGLVGELDHCQDSIIHFERASHLIEKLYWQGNNLMMEALVLNSPMGKVLRSLLNDNVLTGVSSRGVGAGKVDENGILVIGESYKLVTFDIVADPSTPGAFQEKVVGKDENFTYEKNNFTNTIKNESNSIHKKDALIACLGGLIQEQVKTLKRGINNG